MLVRFQKSLLRRVSIGTVKRPAAVHTAHREELQLPRFATQLYLCFEPIHLRFLARCITLRHEDTAMS